MMIPIDTKERRYLSESLMRFNSLICACLYPDAGAHFRETCIIAFIRDSNWSAHIDNTPAVP